MKNATKRIITGSLWGIILLAGIIYSPLTALFLFGILALLSQHEFLKQFSGKAQPSIVLSLLSGILVYAIISLYALNWISDKFLMLLMVPVVLIPIFELFRQIQKPLLNIQVSMFSVLYTILPLALLNFFNGYGTALPGMFFQFTLSFFVVIWTNDTMAYFVGMSLGKHPLYKKISPKKSWEGFFGGLIFSMLMSFALAYFFKGLSLYQWIIFSGVTAIFAVLGDLVESMIKRELGLKDSGNILPGHGGMLDRMDSVFIAAPVVWMLLVLMGVMG